jgi:diadenosine tetraphosphate (Ap4A) HIT family hydrolase
MSAAVFATLHTLANHLKQSTWLTAQGSCSMLHVAVLAYAVNSGTPKGIQQHEHCHIHAIAGMQITSGKCGRGLLL